jgi:tryptophanyl-tRNA synthetase
MTKPVILTGLRANNDLTLGNYFGGMLPIIDMAKNRSDEYQINMFIPDLHSFTTPIDHSKLYEQILHNARLFMAAGLPFDNPDIYLYRQSHVPAHSELTWILDCFTGFGQMRRMTQFKDKSGVSGDDTAEQQILRVQDIEKSIQNATDENNLKQAEAALRDELIAGYNYIAGREEQINKVSVGLFNYPVLMAADILLYGAQYVPVGDDQTQHLEYARDIAERINKRFGDIFTVPEPVAKQHEFFGNDQGLRIKDLVDPTKKMSKSDEGGRGVIYLGDDPDVAFKKVMGAATDDKATIRYDIKEQPGISNLIQISSLLSGYSIDYIEKDNQGKTSYGDFKSIVAQQVKAFLIDFQLRLASVSDDQIISKLEDSEEKMRIQANETLFKVQQAVGLRPKEN